MANDNNTWIDHQLDYIRDHRLHPVTETIFSWVVAILCLIYYGYSYIVALIPIATTKRRRIALMTEAQNQEYIDHAAMTEYLHKVIRASLCLPENLDVPLNNVKGIISQIRSDSTLRRQVSQFTCGMTTMNDKTPEMKKLYIFLDSIWLDLLRLPSFCEDHRMYPYRISLIIPAYKETGKNLCDTLRVALKHCQYPKTVQVIIVDAGRNVNLDIVHDQIKDTSSNSNCTEKLWGEIKIIHFDGVGRGPCQNYGAEAASGEIFTFLHSDTLLPLHWDTKVQRALQKATWNGAITHACSFSVGHNLSNQVVSRLDYPYGIRSIFLLGNFRAWLFRLPYGDHILSFHALHFRYIGGFPNQKIMEDYSLMNLLRERATILQETLRIIPPPTGLCSVRRWQSYGVVYVTLVNALLVHRYAYCGWTADEVFNYYYLRPLTNKES